MKRGLQMLATKPNAQNFKFHDYDLDQQIMSAQDLKELGLDKVVYVQELGIAAARALFPEIDELPERGSLFSVHAADGTPILLAEDLSAATIAATDHDLQVMQVH